MLNVCCYIHLVIFHKINKQNLHPIKIFNSTFFHLKIVLLTFPDAFHLWWSLSSFSFNRLLSSNLASSQRCIPFRGISFSGWPDVSVTKASFYYPETYTPRFLSRKKHAFKLPQQRGRNLNGNLFLYWRISPNFHIFK